MAKGCWAPPKGKGKGDMEGYGKPEYGKGTLFIKGYNQYGKNSNQPGKGAYGKGGPKCGCWTCGGNHYASDCPNADKGKGGGKGVNGVGEKGAQDNQDKEERMGLGGGKGEEISNEWNYRGTDYMGVWAYSLEYDTNTAGWKKVMKNGKAEKEDNFIYNVYKGIWEKIIFVGDSGAVDHVMNTDTAGGFKRMKPRHQKRELDSGQRVIQSSRIMGKRN